MTIIREAQWRNVPMVTVDRRLSFQYKPSMKLEGKVAVVTGASMGIGEAIAALFVKEGAAVVVASRDLARAEAARQRIGHADRTLAVACDVRRRGDLEALLNSTLSRFGRVDIWINNAGHGLLDSVEQMSIAECRSMFDTNLFGAIEAMQVAIPQMKRQGAGTIVNISSVAGHIAVPYMAAYCATKAALNSIGRAARVELQRTGVHVMTVCPGYVSTSFSANAVKGTSRQRIAGAARRGIPPERVAAAVLRGVMARKREIVVPWRDRLVIKLYQNAPRVVEWMMARMLKPATN
jgi:short-subunit dehydrogenase